MLPGTRYTVCDAPMLNMSGWRISDGNGVEAEREDGGHPFAELRALLGLLWLFPRTPLIVNCGYTLIYELSNGRCSVL